MKRIKKTYNERLQKLLGILVSSILMVSCASISPGNIDVKLKDIPPEPEVTSFTDALHDLGVMTEIYDTKLLKIMSKPIGDDTGTAIPTGGEIPGDITEMIKSTLNSIGGKIVYIPYDPAFIQNTRITGYSNLENKIVPNVVLSGGITEFDRALMVRGSSTDVSGGAEIEGLPGWLPGKDAGLRYRNSAKYGIARITLDFNLLNFEKVSGIPRVTAVNTMKVSKAVGERELGISIFGQVYGKKGSIKRVQGRHEAVRLLVEMSMIQIIGKYAHLPYWRLLGDDTMPDRDVIEAKKREYYSLSRYEVIEHVQKWLFRYGYDVIPNGRLDRRTLSALCKAGYMPAADGTIDLDTFISIYMSIPIDEKTIKRQTMLSGLISDNQTKSLHDNQEDHLHETDISLISDQCNKRQPLSGSDVVITSKSDHDPVYIADPPIYRPPANESVIGFRSGIMDAGEFGWSPWFEFYNNIFKDIGMFNMRWNWDIAFKYAEMKKDNLLLTSRMLSNYLLTDIYTHDRGISRLYAGIFTETGLNSLETSIRQNKKSIDTQIAVSTGLVIGSSYQKGDLSAGINLKYNLFTGMEYRQTNRSFQVETREYDYDGIALSIGLSYSFD